MPSKTFLKSFVIFEGSQSFGKLNTLIDRLVKNGTETLENSYVLFFGGDCLEEYGEQPLRAVEGFVTRDDGTVKGLYGR